MLCPPELQAQRRIMPIDTTFAGIRQGFHDCSKLLILGQFCRVIAANSRQIFVGLSEALGHFISPAMPVPFVLQGSSFSFWPGIFQQGFKTRRNYRADRQFSPDRPGLCAAGAQTQH